MNAGFLRLDALLLLLALSSLLGRLRGLLRRSLGYSSLRRELNLACCASDDRLIQCLRSAALLELLS